MCKRITAWIIHKVRFKTVKYYCEPYGVIGVEEVKRKWMN